MPPTTTSIAAILERLEAVRAGSPGPALLAFDADGTLWDGDVGNDFFEALVDRNAVRDDARDALAAEARGLGLRDDGSATEIGRRLLDAFFAGRYDEATGLAMMAWAFAGYREAEVLDFAFDVARVRELSKRLRSSFAVFMDWARERDVEVFVVSASPIASLYPGTRQFHVPDDHVIAMTPATSSGVLLPRLSGAPVYGEGKLRALRDKRPDSVILGAFGDSAWDAAMLRAARVPVAVAPSQKLVALFDSIPGIVVLAR